MLALSTGLLLWATSSISAADKEVTFLMMHLQAVRTVDRSLPCTVTSHLPTSEEELLCLPYVNLSGW